ncbi:MULTISPECIES: low molecular weight protein-tyrosine-phosphatase [Nocardioides]|uniref:protein-tyrosine-phosphatase n=1 Tax=Nocardioides vastitatis TaxID=2568655 RepID=A0ABW0ZEQ6_9ACTN|nr:low molecular weight protein-tyrosine-phosphatase [Nocardioides sp.]THI95845.1 low molecular weight phosphotyrosine protein phosphatase [Nocardioides sp.]
MAVGVPPPRTPGRYRIAVVCLGNICRSPIAGVVLSARIEEAGLADAVEVVSAGTGDWHTGEPMDRRAAALLSSEGYDGTQHRAQQVDASWLVDHDLLLAMDRENLQDLRALGPVEEGRVRLFRDYDPEEPGSEVPDPYFGGESGFREVLAMVHRTSRVLVSEVSAALARA